MAVCIGEDERNDERIAWTLFSCELLRTFVAPENCRFGPNLV